MLLDGFVRIVRQHSEFRERLGHLREQSVHRLIVGLELSRDLFHRVPLKELPACPALLMTQA